MPSTGNLTHLIVNTVVVLVIIVLIIVVLVDRHRRPSSSSSRVEAIAVVVRHCRLSSSSFSCRLVSSSNVAFYRPRLVTRWINLGTWIGVVVFVPHGLDGVDDFEEQEHGPDSKG